MLDAIGRAICVACMLMGVACWFASVFFMFRAMAHRKPGVPLFPGLWESPANILFRPSQLTERGLKYRGLCFLSILGFLLSWIAGMLVGVVAGVSAEQ